MSLRLFLLVGLCGLVSSQVMGQRVSPMLISPWGLSTQSASYQLDASLGELAVRTFTQSGQTLNQGFHQYYENTPPIINRSRETEVLSRLRVYPNPSSGELHLELPAASASLRIFSLDGRLVWSGQKPSGVLQWTLHLHELHAGWYLLQVINDGLFPQSIPFVKQ